MPRARRTVLADAELPGGEDIGQDPAPAASRTRARRVPAKRAPARASTRKAPRALTEAQMVSKVRDEVGMYLSLIAGGWELKDPICAETATQERIDAVADKVTAIIARSSSALELASKTGIIGEIVGLIHALWPIAREVWRNHGPTGVGHKSLEEVEGEYAARFPAYGGAGG